jgi:hypothetical protein
MSMEISQKTILEVNRQMKGDKKTFLANIPIDLYNTIKDKSEKTCLPINRIIVALLIEFLGD